MTTVALRVYDKCECTLTLEMSQLKVYPDILGMCIFAPSPGTRQILQSSCFICLSNF